MDIIKFIINEPQILTLSDPTGDLVDGQVFYPTTDGKILQLPRHAAVKLNSLYLEAGEEVSIARYRKSEREPAEWVFALTARTEKARAAKEASELENQLRESLESVQRKGVMPSESTTGNPRPAVPVNRGAVRELKPTGTDGPAPQPQLKPQIAAKSDRQTPPPRISYREAIREITGTVTALLKETGEQWNDQAKQDYCSTIFIAWAKSGGIVFDVRRSEVPNA